MTAIVARVVRAVCRYAHDLTVSDINWQRQRAWQADVSRGDEVGLPMQRSGGAS